MSSDGDDPYDSGYKEIDDTAEWTEENDGEEKVCRIARGLAVVEHSCVAVFYFMGWQNLVYPAMALQTVFFSVAAIVDYKIYKKIGSPFGTETVKTIMLIPVSCLNIPQWSFHLLVLSPNYIHVTSTAVTSGGVWHIWEDAKFQGIKRNFQKHWAYVPLVGGMLGSAGLPWVMTVLLLFSCVVHLLFIFGWLPVFGNLSEYPGEVCDAANLQFLTKAMKRSGWRASAGPVQLQERFQYSRLAVCALLKYPMLWAKTSMLAVTYEFMDPAMFQSTMFSLALAWYGILQLMPNFCVMVHTLMKDGPCGTGRRHGEAPCRLWLPSLCLFIMLLLGLIQQAFHLFGVFYCSQSHDFSVMLGGCSPT